MGGGTHLGATGRERSHQRRRSGFGERCRTGEEALGYGPRCSWGYFGLLGTKNHPLRTVEKVRKRTSSVWPAVLLAACEELRPHCLLSHGISGFEAEGDMQILHCPFQPRLCNVFKKGKDVSEMLSPDSQWPRPCSSEGAVSPRLTDETL